MLDKKHIKRINGDILGNLIFYYSEPNNALWFIVPDASGLVPANGSAYLLHLNQIIIYRYVTKKDFYAKVKDKYDSTCLNIILKRLLDQNFEW